jgi:hypothetical protein
MNLNIKIELYYLCVIILNDDIGDKIAGVEIIGI